MIKKIYNDTRSYIRIFSKPSHLKVLYDDYRRKTGEIQSNEIHLNEAMKWLCFAQDITKCGGVSAGYSMDTGWRPPYPETTGYIINTFLNYSDFTGDEYFLNRAVKMGDWEIEIQMPDGAVRGGTGINNYPVVFNTGQVILGWTSLYSKTKDERFRIAAKKAADWLIKVQDNDGKWSKHEFNNKPHAYHTRVAWPILKVYALTNDEKYKESALRNLNWVLSHVKDNGWFDNMGFVKDQHPFTHTIAYTLRGFLESTFYLDEDLRKCILSHVIKASENIMVSFELKKKSLYSMPHYLAGNLNSNWKQASSFSCLTGNVQLAIIWLKLYKLTNDSRYLNSALKIIDHDKAKQDLKSKNPGIRGAIAGSFPAWGNYMQYSYPNWATKFFADAIMLQELTMRKLEV